MNRWYQVRRLRGAVFLILIGVLALLNQWDILHWDVSWPLFLIVWGLMVLAERTAWTADVREQQAAQGFGPAMGQNMPPNPQHGETPWGTTQEKPFVQPQPPTSEDSTREGR